MSGCTDCGDRSNAVPAGGRGPDEGPSEGFLRGAKGWVLERAEGGGPFASRLTWALPAGGEAVWDSRTARRRGLLLRRDAEGHELAPIAAEPRTRRRLARI